jgi:quercetin dioxygenase-like cupin family protein
MVLADDLTNFRDWWLANRPFNTPEKNVLSHVADTHGVVLFRQGPYQVELFNVKPNSTIPAHIHPNVDSYEVYVGGDIEFMREGELYKQHDIGGSIRIFPASWHGGNFGERGGCFLSIQKWLNETEPKFVGDDWDDANKNTSYKSSKI